MPNLLVGGAVGGMILGLWGQIRVVALKVAGLFVVRMSVRGGSIQEAVARLLMSEFKCSPVGMKDFSGITEYVRPEKRNLLVAMEKIPLEPTIWWRGWRPLIVNGDTMAITFIRGIWNCDDLLIEAVKKFNDANDGDDWKRNDRFFVRRKYGSIGSSSNSKRGKGSSQDSVDAPSAASSDVDKLTSRPLVWKREELGLPNPEGPMDHLWLSDEIKDALQEAIRWRNSEKWFKERGVPWKNGWLLHGKPGKGKTAFTRALGQELNMPIYSFDLPTMTNQDFTEEWEDVMGHVPCIALFEDFDAVFEGRKNVATEGKIQGGVTFDCILNQMDGVENTDGIFIIVTTNDLSRIDPAIGAEAEDGDSSRPGRVNRSLEFDILPENGKRRIAERILGGFQESEWTHLIEDSKELTGAQFQYRCSKLAMRLFWEHSNDLREGHDNRCH